MGSYLRTMTSRLSSASGQMVQAVEAPFVQRLKLLRGLYIARLYITLLQPASVYICKNDCDLENSTVPGDRHGDFKFIASMPDLCG